MTPVIVSLGQQRLWALDLVENGSSSYNMPFRIDLKGRLDIKAFEKALELIVERHQPLRTVIIENNGEPEGFLQTPPCADQILSVSDLSDLKEPYRSLALEELAFEESVKIFDLARDYLIRVRLVGLGIENYSILVTVHHCAADGVSIGLLLDELIQSYQGKPPVALDIDYPDYAAWQRESLQEDQSLTSQCDYWVKALKGATGILTLGTDRTRVAQRSKKSELVTFRLAPSEFQALETLARKSDTTVFSILLAGFAYVLGRISGQRDVVIGTSVSGRSHEEMESLIGFFINTLAIRTSWTPEDCISHFLRHAADQVRNALSHSEVPFEQVVERLDLERSTLHHPVFQAMFSWQPTPMQVLNWPNCQVQMKPVAQSTVKFDLNLSMVRENDASVSAALEFDASLFNTETIENWTKCLQYFYQSLPAVSMDSTLGLLGLSSAESNDLALHQYDGLKTDLNPDTLVDLFQKGFDRYSERIALVQDQHLVTYADLHAKSNQMARFLIKQGAGPEEVVAILVDRSIEAIVAMLAVLKAGASYLPLDPAQPSQRMEYILIDSGAKLLYTSTLNLKAFRMEVPSSIVSTILCDDDETMETVSHFSDKSIRQQERISPLLRENLAYLIYTSGSTGQPKGAGISHASISDHLVWRQNLLNLSEKDVVLQKTPQGFDVSVWEWCLPLIVGARLVIATPEGHKDSIYLKNTIQSNGVTVLHFVASMLEIFLEEISENECSSIEQIVTSGEAVSGALQNKVAKTMPGTKFWNLYGPTEATIDVTYWLCRQDDHVQSPPIGHAVWNTQLFILDDFLSPVVTGAIGELYIAGDQLARGYLGKPGLTSQRFIACPYSYPGARMYRTGDLARRLGDGAIQFLGRADDQVKIRGNRIELGEIETSLVRVASDLIAHACVSAFSFEGDTRLVAYVVPRAGVDLADGTILRTRLAIGLADYMLPSQFVSLDKLPIGINGKLDRKQLPAPHLGIQTRIKREPESDNQKLVCQLFEELIGVDRIGIDDDFFSIGGHSLLAMRLVTRLRQSRGVSIPLKLIFDRATPESIARLIDQSLENSSFPSVRHTMPAIECLPLTAQIPTSFAQERLLFMSQFDQGYAAYNMPSAIRLKGALNVLVLEQAIGEIVNRHQSLRTCFGINGEETYQSVRPYEPWALDQILLKQLPETERIERAHELAALEATRSFDLSKSPLLRSTLLVLDDDDYVLLLTIHHIASDGWSIGVLQRELTMLYRDGLSASGAVSLAPLSHQYADFAVWQRKWLNPEKLSIDLEYWKNELANLSTLELPLDYPRPAIQGYSGQAVRGRLSSSLCAKLNNIAREHEATLFMVLMSGFMTLMAKWSGQSDIVVGTPVANRVIPELEPMIGFFVNSLVMRTNVSSSKSYIDVLEGLRASALKAYEHQNLPFEKLVEAVSPKRDLSRHPLYQVVFALQNNESADLSIPNVELEAFDVKINRTRYELECHAWENEQGIELLFTYNEALFKHQTIIELSDRFVDLLESIVQDPLKRIGDHSILSVIERYRLIAKFNDTEKSFQSADLGQLFTRQAQRHPDRIALEYQDISMTFSELDASSNRLARRVAKLGFQTESMVAIALPRSIDFVVSVIGLLKSAVAFLPIDIDYPASRIEYILSDSCVRLIITTHSAWDLVLSNAKQEKIEINVHQIIFLDDPEFERDVEASSSKILSAEELVKPIFPQQLAYAIYTSGSTGLPKAVGATHESVVNLCLAQAERFAVTETSKVLQFASPSFDAAISEIFVTLLAGAGLVLAQASALKDEEGLRSVLTRYSVSHATLPPALLRVLEPSVLFSLTSLAVAGEACPAALVTQFGVTRRMINAYGPTEATVCASMTMPLTPAGLNVGAFRDVPIGVPNVNTQIYVLDDALMIVPIGTPGEIYIAGVGLARGYLNRPGLTSERFIANPFGYKGSRMYRSGDIGCWDASGQLHFLGRVDDQVKIRGYRIEPGEIQAAIENLHEVEQALVVPRLIADEIRLIAYLTLRGRATSTSDSAADSLASARRDEWLTLYDDTHSHLSADEVRLNVSGWNSSYTRGAIAVDEMDRWRTHTVDRIKSIPKCPAQTHYLEIGCGTGLLMWLLAAEASAYTGTDFSGAVLDHLRPLLKKEGFDHVSLIKRQANEFDETPENCVDVTLINSVIQYFPTLAYLKEVVQGGVRASRQAFFAGDVRSLLHENAFYVSVALAQAEPELDTAAIMLRAKAMRERERELLVHPVFFHLMSQELAPAGVDLQIKRGHDRNEMLRYRYDVVIKKGDRSDPLSPDDVQEWTSLKNFQDLIRLAIPDRTLELRNIPNDRIFADVWAAKSIGSVQMSAQAFLQAAELASITAQAIDPELLWQIGEEQGFRVRVTWSLSRPEYIHALFEPNDQSDRLWLPEPQCLSHLWQDWELVNDPLQGSYKQQQIDKISAHLSAELPAYMLPSGFVVIDKFPVNQNGKINKAELPDPELSVKSQSSYVSPESDLEILLSEIFKDLTGSQIVGVEDNFFDLGGHSLLAMRLVSRVRTEIGLELPLQVLFEHPTVRALAVQLQSANQESSPALIPGSGDLGNGEVKLSLGQIRLWTIDQLESNTATYNMPSAYRLTGDVNAEALRLAVVVLLNRHQALRTIIVSKDGVPVGRLLNASDLNVPFIYEDLGELSAQEKSLTLQRYLDEDASLPFDLTRDFLLRVRLLKLGEKQYALLLNAHHIAADGVSINIILRDLAAFYKNDHRDELEINYADYAVWHEAWLQKGESKRQVSYWKSTLQEAPELLTLLTDYPRSANRSMIAAHEPVFLNSALVKRLEQIARNHNTTIFSVLLGGYAYMLSKFSNQSDVVIGTPVAGRNRTEFDPLVGFFVNTLALRISIDPTSTVDEYLQDCAHRVLQALSHQDAPFERVVDELGVRRSLSQSPLFQAMLAWHVQSIENFSLDAMKIEPIATKQTRAKCDLTLSLVPQSDGTVIGGFEYDASLYSASTARRWVDCLIASLTSLSTLSDKSGIGEINVLSGEACLTVLNTFNKPSDLPSADTLVDLFNQQAQLNANRIALIFGDQTLTYKDLARASNKLARHLISIGIGSEDIVAINLPRSIDVIVSMLAVIKAGAAYLPMDPDYPRARLRYMLKDSQSVALITYRDELEALIKDTETSEETGIRQLISGTVLCLDDSVDVVWDEHPDTEISNKDRRRDLRADNLAYLIYTSGSTGQPKGVTITHDGIVNFARLQAKIFDVSEVDRVLEFASTAFDAAVSEIYLALTNGAALVLAPGDQLRDPVSLPKILKENGVTHAALPPSLLAALSDDDIATVRSLTVAGEICPPSIVGRYGRGRRMSNGYGPTEVTVGASINSPIDPDDPDDHHHGKISIGQTLPNKRVYILDAQLAPVPVGVVGELYVSGVGLARGYLWRPGMTAERFIACPFGTPGSRMYRTGDLASWRSNGLIDFHGRADQQVKVRGFRIEMSEIESALAQEAGIKQVAVVAWDFKDEVRLAAYLVSSDAQATAKVSELRQSLMEKLPDYMIPSSFTFVDAFKQTSNGKLDRSALPEPDFSQVGINYRCPRSPLEILVAKAFSDLTGAPQVGLDDNFFNLGGHSLLAMRLIAQLRENTGVTLALRKLFEAPTVEGLSQCISTLDPVCVYQPLLPLKIGRGERVIFCFPAAGGNSISYRDFANKISSDYSVWGLQARGSEINELPHQSINEMAEAYADAIESLKPAAPIHLIGWSFGGNVCHAVAGILEQRGYEIAIVAILDSQARFTGEQPSEKDQEELLRDTAKDFGVEYSEDETETFARFVDRFVNQGLIPPGTPSSWAKRVLNLMTLSEKLRYRHRPEKIRAPILLFLPQEGLVDGGLLSSQSWSTLTQGHVRLEVVPGNHMAMLGSPTVDLIAQVLETGN